MLIFVPAVLVVLGLFVLVMWAMMRGRVVMSTGEEVSGIVDPLTLKPLDDVTWWLKLAVPTEQYTQEVVEFKVNLPTLNRCMGYGPIAFMKAFSELDQASNCVYIDAVYGQQPIDVLREKLFAGDEVHERVKLIHDLTETDFVQLYEDDESAVLAHFSRCGFAPLEEEQEDTTEEE